MTRNVLEAQINYFYYPGTKTPALENINLDIKKGEIVVITGGGASGKTTLAYCLCGAIPNFVEGDYNGSVSLKDKGLDDKDISSISLPKLAKDIGLVLEDPQNQLFHLSVEEDVAFGPGNLMLPKDEIKNRVEKALSSVGLENYRHRNPETLSGGEAQRVVLASILALNQDILILDLPAGELDPLGRKQIYQNLKKLCHQENKTMIMIEDRFDEVIDFASRYIVLKNGNIVIDQDADYFWADENLDKLNSLGIRIPSNIGTRTDELRDKTNYKTDNTDDLNDNKNKIKAFEPIIKIQNLSHYYPSGECGIKDVNLDIGRKEFISLIGKNGAGKTTLAKHIVKLLTPTEGTVILDNKPLEEYRRLQLANKIGYMFQNPEWQIFKNTVFEQIEYSLEIQGVSNEERKIKVNKLLQNLGIENVAELHPYRLSKGNIQLLGIASALINDPDVIIMDEPCNGVDYNTTLKIMNLLRKLSNKDRSVILITHDIEMALKYSDRIIMLDDSKVIFDDSPLEFTSEFTTNPQILETEAH
ncbi:ABC transporter ATP-binding protein [Natranaerofaba carboxydovora]|uniref:ABC transporter ATP-binding protein n=1 Tax=Natranaerofaba carboxydovora TaxID=2742683 RepID=UPI001F1362CF|nr:energy-coupling factor transporter ATPase [Natranaerofaba carboxydovora]UMZ73780.1 Putative HMP/thiamine import ATP-binding protein YkoD [Natranaerofaba carboxydovora]